jgi:beta-galactosidase
MLENYLVPGECGGREDVRRVEIGNGESSIVFRGLPSFHFSALHFRIDDLQVPHNWELVPRKETYLRIDGWHMGVGGDTGWTPNVHPEYMLRPGRWRWGFEIIPESRGKTNIFE